MNLVAKEFAAARDDEQGVLASAALPGLLVSCVMRCW